MFLKSIHNFFLSIEDILRSDFELDSALDLDVEINRAQQWPALAGLLRPPPSLRRKRAIATMTHRAPIGGSSGGQGCTYLIAAR